MNGFTAQHVRIRGRKLAFCEYGDPDGYPVIYNHGSPSSRLEGRLFHDAGLRLGLRIIAVDRPGFGQSDFVADRTIGSWSEDVRALLNQRGIERFSAFGWSGGGAHTVSLAYGLASRIDRALVLCGYTNWAEIDGASSTLESPLDRSSVWLATRFPLGLRWMFGAFAFLARRFPTAYMRMLISTMSRPDRILFEQPDFRSAFLAAQQEAYRQGGRATAVDAEVHYRDWGFRLAEVPGPVEVMHGDDDHLVPFAFGEHLADRLPKGQLTPWPGAGHLFPGTDPQRVLEALIPEHKPSLPPG